MNLNNKVILWGVDDFNILGLLRELGSAGVDMTFVVKGKAGYAAQSKYCSQIVETKYIEDGLDYLRNLKTKDSPKPILITSGDGISVAIDQHKKELEQKFIIPGTRQQGLLEQYTDKYTMASLAEKLGFNVPWTKLVKWDSDISSISYPCIIKPSHQLQGHYNEFKFRVCYTPKDLRKTLHLVRHNSVFVVQQYVPKERDLLVYGARMQDGETVLAGCMIRDRMADSGSFSHGFITKEFPIQFGDVEKGKISSFLNAIDYCGLFSFEYGLTSDKAYFFEVNLRNDGCSHYFFQAGANMPLAWVLNCAGEDYSMIQTQVTSEGWFVDEVFDIENVLHRKLSFRQWRRDKEEATIFKYYDKEDIKPWKYVRGSRFKQLIQDIVLSRFRLYVVYVFEKLGVRK